MKFIREEMLVEKGTFAQSRDYRSVRRDIKKAILGVVWPPGSTSFTILALPHANGVVPIRQSFQENLVRLGWTKEARLDIDATEDRPGPIDAVRRVGASYFAVEWETGNISSSHRSLNKLVLGIRKGLLVGATLVLPSGALYPWLTDRVGSYSELAPYFPVWRALPFKGVLSVVVVEHDATSADVPHIPKGTDGRALR